MFCDKTFQLHSSSHYFIKITRVAFVKETFLLQAKWNVCFSSFTFQNSVSRSSSTPRLFSEALEQNESRQRLPSHTVALATDKTDANPTRIVPWNRQRSECTDFATEITFADRVSGQRESAAAETALLTPHRNNASIYLSFSPQTIPKFNWIIAFAIE